MTRGFRHLRSSDFVRHATLIFAATMAVNVLNFVFHFATSRLLGVVAYGTLSSLIAVQMIGAIPGTVGSLLVAKIVAELHARNQREQLQHVAGYATLGSVLIGLICATAMVAGHQTIAAFLNISDDAAILILAVILACSLISPVLRAVLQGMEEFGWFAACGFVEVSAKTAIGVALAWAGYGLKGALTGYAIGTVASVVFAIAVIALRLGLRRGAVSVHLVEVVRSSIGILASTAATTIIGFADLLLVKHYFDPHSAGIYGAVSLVGKVLLYAMAFVPTVLLPKAVAQVSRGERATKLLAEAGAVMSVVAVAGIAVFMLAGPFVVKLFVGIQYVAAASYLPRYGLAMVLLSAAGFGATYRTAINRYGFVIPLTLVAAIEIIGIVFWHQSLGQVIAVLIVANAVAAASTLFGMLKLKPRGLVAVQPTSEVGL